MKLYEGIDTYITTSREKLKSQLVEYFKEYLQLDEIEINKSSALGYLLQIITMLTSNILMYSTITHRDSTLITAQIPESIYDLSAYIGYSPKMATSATVDALITISMDNAATGSTIVFDKGFKFLAENITFTNNNKCSIEIDSNQQLHIYMYTEFGKIQIPFEYSSTDKKLQFLLKLRQYSVVDQIFYIPSDIKPYQFYKQNIPISPDNYLYDILVYVDNVLWTRYDNMFAMSSSTKGYVVRMADQSINLYFGNGLFGMTPPKSSEVKVSVYETLGKQGNIIPASITSGDPLSIDIPGGTTLSINYTVTNTTPGYNGLDQESVDETRRNAIINLKSLNRLVSTEDYKNINKIIPLSTVNSISILKRSDIKCNEIVLYNMYELFANEPIPMITTHLDVLPNNLNDLESPGITFNQEISPGNNKDFILLFELHPNINNLLCEYYYYARYSEINLEVEYLDIDNGDFFLTKLAAEADYTSSKFIFKLYYQLNNSTVISNFDVHMSLNQGSYNKQLNFIPVAGESYVKAELNFSDTLAAYINSFITIKNSSGELVGQYSGILNIKLNLSNYMNSHMIPIKNVDGTIIKYRILDIPMVDNEWYENLNVGSGVDLRKTFEQRIIQNNILEMDKASIRMTNTYINNKYVNTVGTLSNIWYNKPTYNCKYRVTTQTEAQSLISLGYINVGDYVLINGGLSSDGIHTDWSPASNGDQFYGHTTHIARLDSIPSDYTYFIPVHSESVYVQSESLRLSFDGNEWFVPYYSTPINISMIVYLEMFDLNYVDYIKTELYKYLKNNLFGINQNFYRSDIISFVQKLDNVVYCKLLEPKIDLLFNFNLEDLSNDELSIYTPQYVYTKLDNIDIKIQKSNTI